MNKNFRGMIEFDKMSTDIWKELMDVRGMETRENFEKIVKRQAQNPECRE